MDDEQRARAEAEVKRRIEENGGVVERIQAMDRRPGQVFVIAKLAGEDNERQAAFAASDLGL